MHRLPSAATLTRFRIASLLIILMGLCAIAAVWLVVHALVLDAHEHLVHGAIAAAAAFLCMVINFILCGRLRCPLCMVPPLQNRRCSRHRTATKLLGSYRLRVALSILCSGHFRCPYCGEPTAMEVRQRGARR
jgi:hypothetical protein